MSNRYWSKWGEFNGQTVGFDGINYYLRAGDSDIVVKPNELDDLVYKILEVKRKVEGE